MSARIPAPPRPPILRTEPPKRHHTLPELRCEAWHGPVADYVKLVAPGTEADPLAVYVQVLAALGCRIGPGTSYVHGEDRHRALLWLLILGDTATGRKGTAEGLSIDALARASSVSSDSSVPSAPRQRSGLNSGEGLLDAFAPDDKGVAPDPRLLVMESEWEGVLAPSKREGNSLSSYLRAAWDGKPLSKMTVASPRVIDSHHLTVIGHITPDELQRGMGGREASNGFLNRFLTIAVRRPGQLIAFPSRLPADARALLGQMVATVEAHQQGEWMLTEPAKDAYRRWYMRTELARELLPERVARATARSSGHLLRLALILAVLDGRADGTIDRAHIEAASAVVDYGAACAEVLYGAGTSSHERRILAALGQGPQTKDALFKAFSNSITAADLGEALKSLKDGNLIAEVKGTPGPQGGRPPTVYSLTNAATP